MSDLKYQIVCTECGDDLNDNEDCVCASCIYVDVQLQRADYYAKDERRSV